MNFLTVHVYFEFLTLSAFTYVHIHMHTLSNQIIADIGTSLTKIIFVTTFFAGFRLAGFIVGAVVLEKLHTHDIPSYHCSPAFAVGMILSVSLLVFPFCLTE